MPRDSIKTRRRRFIQTVGAASIAGIAGCTGGDSDGSDDSNGGDSNGGDSNGGDDGTSEPEPDDDFPSKTIRIIVPYGEGGGTDVYARGLQPYLEEAWGTDIVIDNVPGAAELRGSTEAYYADPDGYTIIFNNGPQLTGALDPDGQPVNWWELEPIGAYAFTAFVLPVRPDDGIEDFDDLVGRFESGEYSNVTSQAVGGSQWVSAQILKMTGTIQWDEVIGYNSSAEQAQAILSGEADTGLPTETTMSEWDDELTPIVTTSSVGSTTYPDLPTLEDFGYPPDPTGNFTRGVNAPPETPENRLEVLRDGFQEAIEGPAQQLQEETGNVVVYQDPDAWAEIWQEGHEQVIETLGDDIEELRELAGY